MDIMHQALQQHAGQPGGTSYQDTGQQEKLVPVHFAMQPEQYQLVAFNAFQAVFFKFFLKSEKTMVFPEAAETIHGANLSITAQ